MSKSIGNTLLIRDFLTEYHPEVLRLFYLSNHYRSPVDYNGQSIEDVNTALHRLYYTRERALEVQKGKTFEERPYPQADDIAGKFTEAMDDDFNTALALSHVFELSKEINRMVDEKDESAVALIASAEAVYESLAGTLGLLGDDLASLESREKVRHLARKGLDVSFVEGAINDRVEARKNKDFQKADEIRNMLANKGITLLDTPKGTQWRIKTSVS
jgi:cysteinyl-tRNA synthetase